MSPVRVPRIDIVVVVEDDVLGPVDLAETDELDVAQPVVERIGRGRTPDRCRRSRAGSKSRRDIDLGQHLVAVLEPAHVDGDREQQRRSRAPTSWRRSRYPSRTRPLIMISTMMAPMTALATEPRPPPRLLPPSTAAVSAVISRPTPVSEPAPPSRAAIEQARERRQNARDDIGEADVAPDRDADIVRRTARCRRSAMSCQPGRVRLSTIWAMHRDHQTNGEAERHADDACRRRDRSTDRNRRSRPRCARRRLQQQHVDDRAHDDQRDQRRQEGAQPQVADQDAVDQPDQRRPTPRRQR